MIDRWMGLALVGLALVMMMACGDDEAESNLEMTPDMAPESTPDMEPESTPDMEPESAPDMTPDAGPESVDEVEQCQAVCAEVLGCPGLVELCSEEGLSAALVDCEEACAGDEVRRGQILAAQELECDQAEPLAIDTFDLGEVCGGPMDYSIGLVASGDFVNGSEVAIVEFNDVELITETLVATRSTDIKIKRVSETEVAVIDRSLNQVTLYESDGVTFEEVGTAETGENSNPQEMVRVGDRYMVTRYGLSELLVLDEDLEEVGTIELDGINVEDLEDGLPEMSQAFDLGNGLGLVFLQNLFNFQTVGDSFAVLVDLEGLVVERQFGLPGGNPFFVLEQPDGFYIALIDNFGDDTGQVVKLDLEADTITRGIILEEDVGGDIISFAPVSSGYIAVVVKPDFTTKLVHTFDGQSETLLETAGYDLGTATYVAATHQVVVTTAAADGTGMLFFDADEPSIETAEGPFSHGDLPAREFISLDVLAE